MPLQAPEAAAAELRHAVVELGMDGVEIATTVDGRDLDDPDLEPFWAAAEELRCLVLIHPYASLAGRGVSRYFLNNLVGNPAESTVALAHLVFGGVLERHPGLRVCMVHGGGFAPYQLGRWDHGFDRNARGAAANLTRPPSDWVRGVFHDTVLHSPASLRFLLDVVGADHVVLGSDYPFEMGDLDPVTTLDRVPGLTADERRRSSPATCSACSTTSAADRSSGRTIRRGALTTASPEIGRRIVGRRASRRPPRRKIGPRIFRPYERPDDRLAGRSASADAVQAAGGGVQALDAGGSRARAHRTARRRGRQG